MMRVQRLLMVSGVLFAASLVAAGTVSAASLPPAGDAETVHAQATGTATATAPAKGGGRPDDRPGAGRPEAAASGTSERGSGRPEGTGRPEGAGRPDGTATAAGTARARTVPTLPPQASPRARAAVEAAAQRQALIRDRVAALKDIPKDADRAEAVKTVMADFGELFRMVAEAVQAVEPRGSASPTATATASGTASVTPTSSATATATATR